MKRAVRRDPLLIGGLTLAYVAFAWTFRGPRPRFWRRMTATGAALGTLALTAEPSMRSERPGRGDLLVGAASAAGLYLIFRVGDVLAARIMPRGNEEIDEVYELRSLAPPAEIAARLALVIGPAEELFWRGFVQGRLRGLLGDPAGTLASVAAYGGAHAVTANATLLGAATVAGFYWSTLHALGASIDALIVSHVLWDVMIFLLAPTRRSRQS